MQVSCTWSEAELCNRVVWRGGTRLVVRCNVFIKISSKYGSEISDARKERFQSLLAFYVLVARLWEQTVYYYKGKSICSGWNMLNQLPKVRVYANSGAHRSDRLDDISAETVRDSRYLAFIAYIIHKCVQIIRNFRIVSDCDQSVRKSHCF